jgi:hypothetical protein
VLFGAEVGSLMRGVDVVRMQVGGSCTLVAQAARDAGATWDVRVAPGTSLPGFVIWHCARIIDWGVNAVVRQTDELAESDEWRQRMRYDLGHGAGVTEAQADDVARTVSASDVAAYADALGASTLAWLDSIGDDDLDRPAAVRAAAARHPLYATPDAWAEVEGLDGLPAWQVLVRPFAGHIRAHMGELEALNALR